MSPKKGPVWAAANPPKKSTEPYMVVGGFPLVMRTNRGTVTSTIDATLKKKFGSLGVGLDKPQVLTVEAGIDIIVYEVMIQVGTNEYLNVWYSTKGQHIPKGQFWKFPIGHWTATDPDPPF